MDSGCLSDLIDLIDDLQSKDEAMDMLIQDMATNLDDLEELQRRSRDELRKLQGELRKRWLEEVANESR